MENQDARYPAASNSATRPQPLDPALVRRLRDGDQALDVDCLEAAQSIRHLLW